MRRPCASPLPDYLWALKKVPRPEISRRAIYRLSVYLRCLQRLQAGGVRTVSSEALAKSAGAKSTQLRKDLACFGQFGVRGLGCDVRQLAGLTSGLLGTNNMPSVILVGVGDLGRALLSYRGFEQEGFEIVAAFDADPDPQRVRRKHISVPVHGMENPGEIIARRMVKMAILTVPAAAAQEVADTLVQLGIAGILNFAPLVLRVPPEVIVNNINLAMELENPSYFVQH
jgi:redox-sensing transcriptional repressor